jgi:hypothetical protein
MAQRKEISMKIVLTILFLIISNALRAEENIGLLRCSKAGTVVLYVNGIMNTDSQAKAAAADMIWMYYQAKQITSILDSKNDVGVTFYYNQSVDIIADLYESAAQKFDQEKGIANTIGYVLAHYMISLYPQKFIDLLKLNISLEDLSNFYLPYTLQLAQLEQTTTSGLIGRISRILASDSKLIIVSHSQGNLFTNSAYNDLAAQNPLISGARRFSDYFGVLRNVQVASPASSIAMQGSHVTNSKDIILLTPGAMEKTDDLPDVTISPDPRDSFDVVMNHGFATTYINGELFFDLKEKVGSRIYNEALNLSSNCGEPPVARFTYKSRADLSVNPDPMTYDFDASTSTDPDEPSDQSFPNIPDYDIAKFEWLIDGIVKLEGMKPFYTFPTEGMHTVQLIVADLNGNKSVPFVSQIDVKKSKFCSGKDGDGLYPYSSSASYSTTTNFRFPPRWFENLRTFDSYNPSTDECKAATSNRSVYTWFISQTNALNLNALSPLPANYPNPEFTYIGCVYDGQISRSLFKFDLDRSGLPLNYALETIFMCDEGSNSNGTSQFDARVTAVGPNSILAIPNYFSVAGRPFCYRYQPFLKETFATRKLPLMTLPVEDCSDCPIGMVKMNGSCTCPEGFKPGGAGCMRVDECLIGTAGPDSCTCANPEGVSTITGHRYFTCNPPPTN